MPTDRIFEVLTRDWKEIVEEGVVNEERDLHQGGLPVVQILGGSTSPIRTIR